MFQYRNAFSSFSIDDVQQAKDFYSKSLGLKVTEVKGMPGLLEVEVAGTGKLMLYQKPNHVPATFTVLNFVVDNIEATVEELTRRDIRFEQYSGEINTDAKGIARGSGPKIAWFKDPSGNILSVLQRD